MGYLGAQRFPDDQVKRGFLGGASSYQRLDSPPLATPGLSPEISNPKKRPKRTCLGQPCAWNSQWVMVVCFVFGVACAIGHHIFYSTLHNQLAVDQMTMQRYGTLLAFGAKAGLSAAVGAAYHQRVWATVRTRVMSVAALDALFAATEDLTSFLSWEMVSAARIAATLAVFVWVSGLVVILTANTLQVEMSRLVSTDKCPGIRTLNFTMEELDEWRAPTRIGNYFEIPAVFWNTTRRPGDKDSDTDWFDYFTSPGPALAQTLTIAAFMGETVMRRNAQAETCGSGWNCTFEIQFVAPAYKCTELASGVGAKAANLTQESGSIAPPFSMDVLVPKGPFTYYAFATGGEYSTTQMHDVEPGGIPKTNRPDPKNLGAFRTEPIIWIGHAIRADPTKPLPATSSSPGWSEAFIPKLFACENYESAYTVTFNLTEGASQSTNVTRLDFLRPVINTTYLPEVEAHDNTADNVTATPESNYIFPSDKRRYRRTAAFHALGLIARSFVNGTLTINAQDANGMPLANSDVIQTNLLDLADNYLPRANLMALVQDFYAQLVLSMLSNPQFASVVWAARPETQSGLLPALTDDDGLKYPCERSRVANLYNYRARDLWIVYGIAILLGLVAVVVGFRAVRENQGVVMDTKFSSIVAATRGPALDKLAWTREETAGRVPVREEGIRGARMGYGMVRPEGIAATGVDEGGGRVAPRVGFAFEGDLVHKGT
ncbi:hypothetical protein QBC47DRAFT_298777 [Echria macrotheca]|uniref:Uncharacterized protein n=1 Tax=Echria macrotheca TaxID=438768 RepID=A0AAJ0BG83_9PEZI|nr:hypothetical protein QBC47DRAFT_298777 [Echria macrotheca]